MGKVSKGDEHAFPHLVFENGATHLKGGLSKRELLAAMAMQAVLARIDLKMVKKKGDERDMRLLVSRAAVYQADALLKELSNDPT